MRRGCNPAERFKNMPKLKIFSFSPLSYIYEGDKQVGYYNAPASGTSAIIEYEGEDAKREIWKIRFEKLDETDKRICNAVFPRLLEMDAATLKTPDVIARIARKKVTRQFGGTCPRCGGSGSYARSVAYTAVDDGICHLCRGSGRTFPRLTEKKIAEITEFFKTEANN